VELWMTLRTKALLSILIGLPVANTLENRVRLISSLKKIIPKIALHKKKKRNNLRNQSNREIQEV
jgi:hypothetical protein